MGLTLNRPVFMLPVLPFPMAGFLAYHLNLSGLKLLDISNENAITEVTIELYWVSM